MKAQRDQVHPQVHGEFKASLILSQTKRKEKKTSKQKELFSIPKSQKCSFLVSSKAFLLPCSQV